MGLQRNNMQEWGTGFNKNDEPSVMKTKIMYCANPNKQNRRGREIW